MYDMIKIYIGQKMTNILKKAFLVLFFITALNAQAAKELSSSKVQEIQKVELLTKANIKVEKAFDIGSMYILVTSIQGKSQELFLTKDKKILIAGNVMNAKTGEPITAPVDLSFLKGKEALTYGTGKDEYYLFTDPECPYCKKFEGYFPQIEKQVKIKIFFFPLSFHENAKDLSIYYMSKKTNAEKIKAMFNVNAKSDEFINRKIGKEEYAKLEKKLDIQVGVAEELGVRGTPTLYSPSGKKLVWVSLLKKYGVDVK